MVGVSWVVTSLLFVPTTPSTEGWVVSVAPCQGGTKGLVLTISSVVIVSVGCSTSAVRWVVASVAFVLAASSMTPCQGGTKGLTLTTFGWLELNVALVFFLVFLVEAIVLVVVVATPCQGGTKGGTMISLA